MRRYLLLLGISFATALAAVVALTVIVDPYAYWNAPRLNGINMYKPASGRHLADTKRKQAERLGPRTLIVGNSRVHVGMDPESGAWPPSARPVYNLGLPGARLDTSLALAKALVERGRVEHIYVGLDFIDFRIATDEGLSSGKAQPDMFPFTKQRDMTVSLAALQDTLLTIAEQSSRYPQTLTDHGLNGTGDYDRLVATEGHAALFAQREMENLKALARTDRRYAADAPNPVSQTLIGFLADMRRWDVKVTLFTYPYHADLLAAFSLMPGEGEFANWKRDMTNIAAQAGVPLWDFARIGPLTTERYPAPGDTSAQLSYYWEAGHFKTALGTEMITQMTGGSGPGVRATPGNIEANLAEDDRNVAAYLRTHPGVETRAKAAL